MNSQPPRNHETYFFRHLEQLNQVVQCLSERLNAGPQRVWSAGCSIGAEPYSLAILLDVKLANRAAAVRLVGTDVDASVLEEARSGAFLPWYLRHCPEALRQRYFEWNGTHATLDRHIARRVEFCAHDLESEARLGGSFDVIVCRNVLMYYERARQKKIVGRLLEQLRGGGLLVVGIAETVYLSESFDLQPVAGGLALFRKTLPSTTARASEPRAVTPPLRPVAPPASGSYKQALRELQDATRYAEQDLPELARAALKRCLYLAPRLSAAHLQLGLLERSMGRHKQAERSFRNALQLAQSAPAEQPAEGYEQWTNREIAELASRMLKHV